MDQWGDVSLAAFESAMHSPSVHAYAHACRRGLVLVVVAGLVRLDPLHLLDDVRNRGLHFADDLIARLCWLNLTLLTNAPLP